MAALCYSSTVKWQAWNNQRIFEGFMSSSIPSSGRRGTLVDALSEEIGTWRESNSTWSVAECLDHLAIGNRVYLVALRG